MPRTRRDLEDENSALRDAVESASDALSEVLYDEPDDPADDEDEPDDDE